VINHERTIRAGEQVAQPYGFCRRIAIVNAGNGNGHDSSVSATGGVRFPLVGDIAIAGRGGARK
jgi:hypothetical protein